MRWNILSEGGDVINVLLKNRGIKDKKEFLNPSYPEFKLNLKTTLARIRLAIKNQEKIVVYGDYDADGICATAIMWETLRDLGAKVAPFIPSREKEGYGLSIEGIKSLRADLIITVDSGIVAHEAVDFANKKGMDVVILDHHEKPKRLPKAQAIVHTPKLCASGIAYFVAKEILGPARMTDTLELAAIATITDLLPLVGPNRSIVKYGLEALKNTKRVGLRALFNVAGIQSVGTYEIGYLIGPRLNASGRIENAKTALDLLCTADFSEAQRLARLLNETNRDRQSMTEEMTAHAKNLADTSGKIIVLDHESYHQGVIGLVAGKLVEQYYLPAIVIARGETVSKASARSISGFNIIEAIRSCESLLINAGGHPMAAGFSIETAKISNFKFQISNYAKEKITPEMLERSLRVDMKIDTHHITMELYQQIQQIAPFGLGNPEPVFSSEVTVQQLRTVGQDGKHLKLVTDNFDAIAFNMGNFLPKLKVGQKVAIAYSVALDTYNFNRRLQLKIRDILC
jgi:single-stranded-DNA-specific exonuclease